MFDGDLARSTGGRWSEGRTSPGTHRSARNARYAHPPTSLTRGWQTRGMDEVLGLPAHPLLVHVPVVLVPLGAATALAALLFRRFRTTLLVVAAGLALVGGVTAYLAAGAGEPLEDRLERTGALSDAEEERLDDHESAGDRAKWASVAFGVVAVAAAGTAVAGSRRGRRRDAARRPSGVVTGLAAASLLVGAVGTTAVALAGHSGARAVWEDDAGTGRPAVQTGATATRTETARATAGMTDRAEATTAARTAARIRARIRGSNSGSGGG